MTLLDSRMIASIAIFAALWGSLNSIFAPAVFRVFGLPILCDVIGFAILTLAVWWTRNVGAATVVGLIATVVNFVFNPAGVHFLGFAAASIVFDITAKLIGYDRCFRKPLFVTVSMLSVSVLSAATAGLIIGTFFIDMPALAKWGGIVGWAGVHAAGGVIGGSIGATFITGLSVRGMRRMDVSAR